MPNPVQSILDSAAISGCYLFPQPRRVRNPFIVKVPGAELACYRNIADPDGLTVVHFHGNGEAVADYVPEMVDELTKLGLNSLFIEYREYGDSTGKAQLVAMLGDGEAALVTAEIPPEKAIVFGRSIGSLYAVELAHRCPNIAGLVIESGIADPAERFLAYADLAAAGLNEEQVFEEVKRHFNHREKMSGYSGPLLVMHTENDGMIDISHAERIYKWTGGSQKRLLRFRHGNHNTIKAYNHDEYFKGVAFLARAAGGQR